MSKKEKQQKAKGKKSRTVFLKSFISGDVLGWGFLRKNYAALFMIFIYIFIFTGNRMTMEKQMAYLYSLKKELIDVKYSSLTISSELIRVSRQSEVQSLLEDKELNLKGLFVPPYSIEK